MKRKLWTILGEKNQNKTTNGFWFDSKLKFFSSRLNQSINQSISQSIHYGSESSIFCALSTEIWRCFSFCFFVSFLMLQIYRTESIDYFNGHDFFVGSDPLLPDLLNSIVDAVGGRNGSNDDDVGQFGFSRRAGDHHTNSGNCHKLSGLLKKIFRKKIFFQKKLFKKKSFRRKISNFFFSSIF